MNCCANLSNLVIYRALLSDPIVNALRRPKEFFAPELEGLPCWLLLKKKA